MTMEKRISMNKLEKVHRYCNNYGEYAKDSARKKRDARETLEHLEGILETIHAAIKELQELYSDHTINNMLEDLEGIRQAELLNSMEKILKYRDSTA